MILDDSFTREDEVDGEGENWRGISHFPKRFFKIQLIWIMLNRIREQRIRLGVGLSCMDFNCTRNIMAKSILSLPKKLTQIKSQQIGKIKDKWGEDGSIHADATLVRKRKSDWYSHILLSYVCSSIQRDHESQFDKDKVSLYRSTDIELPILEISICK